MNFNSNNHLITIVNINSGNKIHFDYWASISNPKIQTQHELLSAFYCFISDCQCGLFSYKEFCDEFGLDANKTNHVTWEKCKVSLQKAEKIDINEDMIYNILNDLTENYGC